MVEEMPDEGGREGSCGGGGEGSGDVEGGVKCGSKGLQNLQTSLYPRVTIF